MFGLDYERIAVIQEITSYFPLYVLSFNYQPRQIWLNSVNMYELDRDFLSSIYEFLVVLRFSNWPNVPLVLPNFKV